MLENENCRVNVFLFWMIKKRGNPHPHTIRVKTGSGLMWHVYSYMQKITIQPLWYSQKFIFRLMLLMNTLAPSFQIRLSKPSSWSKTLSIFSKSSQALLLQLWTKIWLGRRKFDKASYKHDLKWDQNNVQF